MFAPFFFGFLLLSFLKGITPDFGLKYLNLLCNHFRCFATIASTCIY